MDSYHYTQFQPHEPFVPVSWDGYYHPVIQILAAVAIGMVFAPFSLGLFLYIIIYLLFEIYYAYLRGFRYTPEEMLLRLLIFIMGLLGFLFGRAFSGDDNPIRFHYDEWSL